MKTGFYKPWIKWPPIISDRIWQHREFSTPSCLWWATTCRMWPMAGFSGQNWEQLPVMSNHFIFHKRVLPLIMFRRGNLAIIHQNVLKVPSWMSGTLSISAHMLFSGGDLSWQFVWYFGCNTNVCGYSRYTTFVVRYTTFVVVTRQVRTKDSVCRFTVSAKVNMWLEWKIQFVALLCMCNGEHVTKNSIVSPGVSTVYLPLT